MHLCVQAVHLNRHLRTYESLAPFVVEDFAPKFAYVRFQDERFPLK